MGPGMNDATETTAIRVYLAPLAWIIVISIGLSSCGPVPGLYAAPPPAKRCAILTTAPWCIPCQAVKTNVIPQLKAAGLTVANYADKTPADIHLVDIDDPEGLRTLRGLDITPDTIPALVVFENGQVVETIKGALTAKTFFSALKRDDLVDKPPAAATPAPPTKPAVVPPWFDEFTKLVGTDEIHVTIVSPGGRTIRFDDAAALVKIPETLNVSFSKRADLFEFKFFPPLHAEATRVHVRIGATIPSATLSQDTATAKTSLGIPIRFKLIESPFNGSN